jgi:hypothetical protein
VLNGLIDYLAAQAAPAFRYVSVHAPVKHRVQGDAASAQRLGELPLWVRSIVTDPDTREDPAAPENSEHASCSRTWTSAKAADGPRKGSPSSSSSCRTPASASTPRMPLTEEDEERFAPVLDRCRDVPWILEARPRDHLEAAAAVGSGTLRARDRTERGCWNAEIVLRRSRRTRTRPSS